MEIKALSPERKMTVKEVSKILRLDSRTIQLKVKELFPDEVINGKTTYLNESQVTMVKLDLEKKFEVKTGLEKKLLIKQGYDLLMEEVHSMQGQIEEMKPKAEFYDQVAGSKDAIDMGTVANVLNIKDMGRTKLFRKLRELGILKENNQPYREFIDRGHFRTIEQTFTKPDGSTHVNIKTVVYQKGVDFIRKAVTK